MFVAYPQITYNNEKIIDISKMYLLKNMDSTSDTSIFFDYFNKNNYTPEQLSYNFYGTCEYFELILLVNNIRNFYTDWYRTKDEFDDYVVEKYGSDSLDEIKYYYYENDYGEIFYLPVDQNTTTIDGEKYIIQNSNNNYIKFNKLKAITNYEYEQTINENRRTVKIIYPDIISDVKNTIIDTFK